MKLLAAADALTSLSGHRRQQVWEAAAWHIQPELLEDAPIEEDFLELPEAPEGEEVLWDYVATGLTLRSHPLALLRPILEKRGWMTATQLQAVQPGRTARACGIVTVRQQPENLEGFTKPLGDRGEELFGKVDSTVGHLDELLQQFVEGRAV